MFNPHFSHYGGREEERAIGHLKNPDLNLKKLFVNNNAIKIKPRNPLLKFFLPLPNIYQKLFELTPLKFHLGRYEDETFDENLHHLLYLKVPFKLKSTEM